MQTVTRREFLGAAPLAAAPLSGLAKEPNVKIGVCDFNLRLGGKPEAVAMAKKLGFDGVQVSFGRKAVDNKLALDNPELLARYLAEASRNKIEIAGTCLDILHVNFLKNDPLGRKWVIDGIQVTRKLDAKVLLLPLFLRGAMENRQEMDHVADILKDLGKEAEKAGVILGLEDTLSAEDNVRILERAGSKAVKVYYDVGNSSGSHFDVIREIRWLGGKRIAQFHLKEEPKYLGDGPIDFPGVMKAIRDSKFRGFANLETGSPSRQMEADMKRNLGYVRRLMEEVHLS